MDACRDVRAPLRRRVVENAAGGRRRGERAGCSGNAAGGRGDDDADVRDADAFAGYVARRVGRGTAATVRIPGGDGRSPAEVLASLAGRPVRLAAAHRWFEETSPGSLRGTPLGAKYRRAFDPDGGADDGDVDEDGAGTDVEEEDRGEVTTPGTPRVRKTLSLNR